LYKGLPKVTWALWPRENADRPSLGAFPFRYNERVTQKSIFLFVLAAAAACRTVPYTGRRQLSLIPADQEAALGVTAYQETLKKEKVSTDPEKNAMVRRVGERIAAAADKPDFQWEFKVIEDDKTVNAWCLPGGKVAVYTGILPVMGHEVAHALARHGGERMSQGMLAQLGGVALSVAMAEKPGQTQALAQQAYGLGVGVGVLLPYGRHQESEADQIGLILMAKAGYDPRAAVDFWTRMAKGEKASPGLERFLRTHPTNEDRIADIQRLLPRR
jgi:metalloendopeptidase OMA1, mitochondrial